MGVMMSEGGNRLLLMNLSGRVLLDMLCCVEAVEISESIDGEERERLLS